MKLSPTNIVQLIQELRQLPEVTIRMGGDASLKSFYETYTSRHPRYKIIPTKRWGVALIPLPGRFEDYLRGKMKEFLRRDRRRCISLGYRFATVDPMQYLEDILAVNTSRSHRQGRPMEASYVDQGRLESYFANGRRLFAALEPGGKLRAYVDAPVSGEVCILARLMGHGDDLAKGIMPFTVSEVVREMIERRAETGNPQWVEYGTMVGAPKGMRHFKVNLGFRPYKVRWTWAP